MIWLSRDDETKTATLVRSFVHPDHLSAGSQGGFRLWTMATRLSAGAPSRESPNSTSKAISSSMRVSRRASTPTARTDSSGSESRTRCRRPRPRRPAARPPCTRFGTARPKSRVGSLGSGDGAPATLACWHPRRGTVLTPPSRSRAIRIRSRRRERPIRPRDRPFARHRRNAVNAQTLGQGRSSASGPIPVPSASALPHLLPRTTCPGDTVRLRAWLASSGAQRPLPRRLSAAT